jgi:hypothetical protein
MCRVPRLGFLLGLNQMAKSQQQFADDKVDLKGDDDHHDDDINNLEVRESSTRAICVGQDIYSLFCICREIEQIDVPS